MFASWGPLAIPSAATLVVLLEVRFALCYVGIADERHVKQIVGRIIASGQRRLLVAIWVLVLFIVAWAAIICNSKASSFRGQLRH